MSSSTLDSPTLYQKVNALNLDQFLSDALDDSSGYTPIVVFISSTNWQEKIASCLKESTFTCHSLHDMLRLGFHHNPFVLVVSKNRAECSTNELQQILSSRSKQPFEIVCHSKINDLELIDAIKKACDRVKKTASIENSIDRTAKGFTADSSPKTTLEGNLPDRCNINEYSEGRNLLKSRIIDYIENKPEDFLKEAISKIRKPPTNL
jgi:hypothetical protein